jgi:hypothetical protein
MGKGKDASGYNRGWKTTLFAILALQGFGLAMGSVIFGLVVTSQPPSIYPVFGYGKPPPIVIEGLSSFYWAILGIVIGIFSGFYAIRSRQPMIPGPKQMEPSVGSIRTTTESKD